MADKFAVIIAVESYHDGSWKPVDYAEADAREFSDVIAELDFRQGNQHILINEDATKARIDSHLRRVVDDLLEDDELFIYYAGHGFSDVSQNYLTCYDSVRVDKVRTSIALQDIFDFVRTSKSQKIILFLDSCHSGPMLGDKDRGVTDEMTETELRAFFKDSEHYACFASCKTNEKSYPRDDYRHGIWTYHLLEALKANEKSVINRGNLITSNSLQNFLARQVPLSLREARTEYVTQTPIIYGAMSKEFIVADVSRILSDRQAVVLSEKPILKRLAFRNQKSITIKSLSGFKKTHRVPQEVNDYTINFVYSISAAELEEAVEKVYKILKSSLGYKRRALKKKESTGATTILTPDFSVEISVSQDEEDPGYAINIIEIVNITNPEMVLSETFNQAFDNWFSTIEFEYSDYHSVEEVIDQIEEIDDDRIEIDSPSDSSYCIIKVRDFSFSIHVTPDCVRLDYDKRGSPLHLLEGLKEVNRFLLTEHEVGLLES